MSFTERDAKHPGTPKDSTSEGVPYDVFVDWDARLARELPFFEALFERVGVRRIADVGCGSGMHAIAFAKQGIEVIGIDPNEDMLEAARSNAADTGIEVRFVEGTFEDAAELVDGEVDVVLALGNGLPHVDGIEGLRRALDALGSIVREGGVLVLHIVNHERLAAKKTRMLPVKHRVTPDGDRLFIRVVDHIEGGFVFNFLSLARPHAGTGVVEVAQEDDGAWHLSEARSLHTAMPPSVLAEELERVGFRETRFYGNHAGKPLDELEDESLIAVALK